MSKGLNRWLGIGRLGHAPEVKHLDGGKVVCNFQIACEENWTDKQGAAQSHVEWVRVQAWGKLAEICEKYLEKGRQVWVEGKLQTRKWEKDGQDHYTTEVVAREVTFLGDKSDRSPDPPPPDAP